MGITVYTEGHNGRQILNKRKPVTAKDLAHALRHCEGITAPIHIRIRDLEFTLERIKSDMQGGGGLYDCQRFLARHGLEQSEPEKLAATVAALDWRYTVTPKYAAAKSSARVDMYDAQDVATVSHTYPRRSPLWRATDADLSKAHADGQKYAAIRELNDKIRVYTNMQTSKT